MKQAALFDTPAPEPSVCAFGETGIGWPGPHHCRQCAEDVEAMCAAFDAKVAAGIYDAEGYTPAERNALQRKRV